MGDDTVKGGIGRDELLGGSGNDKLIGGLGSDALLGGEGDDTLRGSEGADTLEGGAGSDRFVFGLTDGRDTISDFEGDLDLIQITGGPADFSDLFISNADGGALVGFAETRVLIDGFEANDLNDSQFLFL